MTHAVQLLVAFSLLCTISNVLFKLFELRMSLLQLQQNSKYTESSFKRQSIKT